MDTFSSSFFKKEKEKVPWVQHSPFVERRLFRQMHKPTDFKHPNY
jgi:hypothetical protein